MKLFGHIFLYLAALLILTRAASDFMGWQKDKASLQYAESPEDWSEESSEEDGAEFEDDFAPGADSPCYVIFPSALEAHSHHSADLKDFISEIVPPPPQG